LACRRDNRGELVVQVAQTPANDAGSHDVLFIPSHDELFSRHRGLIETDRLAGNRVAVFGVGSVGSICALELVKSGVGTIELVDHDRLELHNVARHACGVSSLGRRKVNAVRDLLLDKNPACRVETHDLDVLERPDVVEEIIQQADVVLIATDNNASRLLINSLCLQEPKLAVYGRAMTRACGLDVIRVRPGRSPCYQCLLHTILNNRVEEISGPRQAEMFAYVDRPVQAEPGLSNDLMPLAHLMVKLVIQHLLQETTSELRSLDQDLTADLYFWANRRTDQHRGLTPMGTQGNQPSVLRWYGVDLTALPRCPLCLAANVLVRNA
jgi:molybdopterin/thiamine biosynthesis adenylyltransferase